LNVHNVEAVSKHLNNETLMLKNAIGEKDDLIKHL
jgi:hypothetical protein